jgi:gamma-glutamylputrescine oxidase
MAAKIIASAISNEWDMIDTLSRIRHIQLPSGRWFSSPAMSLGMLFYRLKDFLASKS